jgi:NitT/TauT family transport system substrate-binding protein
MDRHRDSTGRRGMTRRGHRVTRSARLASTAVVVAAFAAAALGGAAASAPAQPQQVVTLTVNTLPIANGFPLDLGIRRGFFRAQRIEINKRTLQSGNDIVLALGNRNGEIGYVGWVPAMIARTQGIPLTAVAASDVEGTSNNDNWQNILVKGDSSIRRPADLSGRSIAVNALKGVGEVMIKAALRKRGVNPNSIRLVAMPFPTMPAALRNGQVDAIWTPEPFMSQALRDGARVVMAPGPVLGRFWPIGTYVAHDEWVRRNPAVARRFRIAMARSLAYAQSHPAEIRELLPAASRDVRLPIWSPLIDRAKLRQLARFSRDFGVIASLPNLSALVPRNVTGGKTLQGTVRNASITLLVDGRTVRTLPEGEYTFVVADRSRTQSFRLVGPGVRRSTTARFVGRATWTLSLRPGRYTYGSTGSRSLTRTFRVR